MSITNIYFNVSNKFILSFHGHISIIAFFFKIIYIETKEKNNKKKKRTHTCEIIFKLNIDV